MTWGRFSTAGAVSSMLVGTISAIVLIALSPTIQIDLLHHDHAIFPLKNPGLVTMSLSFAAGIVASLVWPDPDAARKFAEVERRIQLGARGDDGLP
jgi:cation/acetate symporter